MNKALLLLFVSLYTLNAEDILFIANSKNPIAKVNKAGLKKIYLKKRRFWKETKLNPSESASPYEPLREAMEKQILGMSAISVRCLLDERALQGDIDRRTVWSQLKSMLLFVKKSERCYRVYSPE